MTQAPDLDIISFDTPSKWNIWLQKNHMQTQGIWIRFYKKASKIQTITYAEALDEALCYGWIDSQTKKYDEQSYLQKFTQRRPKSIWSQINTQHIERLIKEGKMKPAGFNQIEEAKKDGRWENAYNSPSTMNLPRNFMKELTKDKKAKTFFDSLNKANVYAIAWRLQTAKKPETKEKRMKLILEMLAKGEKFH